MLFRSRGEQCCEEPARVLIKHARGFFTALFTPFARWLLRIGVSPDAVTIIGTAGVVVGALVFYPLGQLWWGTLFITAFIFSDVLDGIMARMQAVGGRWGNFLDSTLDRIADGALFAGLAVWFFTGGANVPIAMMATVCLVLGMVVSYARAKAESLGFTANVGIAAHLHQHIVPRWGGDGNFFPIIAQTKAITQTLDEVRQQVADAWPGETDAE